MLSLLLNTDGVPWANRNFLSEFHENPDLGRGREQSLGQTIG